MKKILSIASVVIVIAVAILGISVAWNRIEMTNTGMLIEFRDGTGYYIGE